MRRRKQSKQKEETMDTNIWSKIDRLKLATVVEKLKSKKGFWWNMTTDTDMLEKQYKQFLYLIVANPKEMIVPWSQKLDDLWHEHILDTQKYTDDCREIAGWYIHHNPHVPKGTRKHITAYSKTQTAYREAFGEKAKAKQTHGSSAGDGAVGCGAVMPVVFCSSAAPADSGHSTGSSCSSASCSSGGGSSCGSSCGGGGCGGGCSS